jgi:hypothetical protein
MQKEQFIALALSQADANMNSNIAWIAGKIYDALVKEGYEIILYPIHTTTGNPYTP